MFEIAIGDPHAGYTVLQGPVSPPVVKSTAFFAATSGLFVTEHLEIQLKGTSAQISTFLSVLETVITRATLYDAFTYASPQYLRFQQSAGGPYYLTPISQAFLESNPAGYLHQQSGSRLVILHYTRPNYFDGPKTELPLTGRAGTNITGGYPLLNHTDSGVGHGSTVVIDPGNIVSALPAPLRFELTFSTPAPALNKDLFAGLFSHPASYSDVPFFVYYMALNGGAATPHAAAIQGYYKTFSWTSSSWSPITYYAISPADMVYFQGGSFRPIFHLFVPHAYTDLYFRVQVERPNEVLFVSEPVRSPPGFGYLMLPPINLPPNFLLGEVSPSSFRISLYGFRESGALTSIATDCLTIFPLGSAASFYGLYNLPVAYTLVDDSHRSRFNIRTTAGSGESVSHARVGGPLMLMPAHYNRIFFYGTNESNLMPIDFNYILKAFYYPRVRLI